MCKGDYIKLNRKIRSNNVWTFDKVNYAQAWVDLIMLANYKENFIKTRNGVAIKINRGECGCSILALSNMWNWSRQKVRTFLARLEEWGMIKTRQESKHTIIEILNYEKYQAWDNKLDNNIDTKDYTKLDNKLDITNKGIIKDNKRKTNKEKKSKQANLEEVINELNLSSEWKDVFEKWLTYKKEEHNDTYKSNSTLKTCIKKVYQECNGNLLKVKIAIENSIAHTWKGIIVQTNNYQTQPRPVMTAPKLEYI